MSSYGDSDGDKRSAGSVIEQLPPTTDRFQLLLFFLAKLAHNTSDDSAFFVQFWIQFLFEVCST